jgi:hypothetical protein
MKRGGSVAHEGDPQWTTETISGCGRREASNNAPLARQIAALALLRDVLRGSAHAHFAMLAELARRPAGTAAVATEKS